MRVYTFQKHFCCFNQISVISVGKPLLFQKTLEVCHICRECRLKGIATNMKEETNYCASPQLTQSNHKDLRNPQDKYVVRQTRTAVLIKIHIKIQLMFIHVVADTTVLPGWKGNTKASPRIK